MKNKADFYTKSLQDSIDFVTKICYIMVDSLTKEKVLYKYRFIKYV